MKSKDDSMQSYLDALHVMNCHLATIKGRVEVLLLAGNLDHIKSDIATVGKAEMEISRIVRRLTLTIIRGAN